MWSKLTAFYNSPWGRRAVNWGMTALGALITSGAIPLDAPIPYLGMSVGVLLTIFGLRLPSVTSVGTTALVQAKPAPLV